MSKKTMIFLTLLLLITVSAVGYGIYVSTYALEISKYSISSDKIVTPIRIVQLSDLHNSVFGEDNGELISAVESLEPDMIFITGDLVNSKSGKDTSIAVSLIRNLKSIAPVYFSYGNQEEDLEKEYSIDVAAVFSDAGATVLDSNFADITMKDQVLRIGGIYGYCQPEVFAQETHRENESSFLKSFQDTDHYKILLCHMPVCWLESGSLYDWDVDCVFSGHAHGGQIRLPFIGGLWAPDQGWFPGQECGVYTTDEESWKVHNERMIRWAEEQGYDSGYYENRVYYPGYLVLSRGLGSTEMIPRFNNIPEIVAVNILPE